MVYIRDGQVVQKRGWSLSLITEMFMAIINMVVIFFQTIFDPSAAKGGSSSSSRPPANNRRNSRGGGGGGGGGRIVDMNRLQADHTARCGGGG